jgi:hypothetical protein
MRRLGDERQPPGLSSTCGNDDRHLVETCALFVWLISRQSAVLFSQNKLAISNQLTVLFSQNKPAPTTSYQPNEQAVGLQGRHTLLLRTTSARPAADLHSSSPTFVVSSKAWLRPPRRPKQRSSRLHAQAKCCLQLIFYSFYIFLSVSVIPPPRHAQGIGNANM